MKTHRLVLVGCMLLIGVSAVMAQEISPDPFVVQLQSELRAYGWTEDQVREFTGAATQLEWSAAEGADPQIVAWSLQAALQSGDPADALTLQERAQLAQALAIHTAQMTRLGYSDRDVASAASRAARASAEQMARIRVGGGENATGEAVRNRIMESVAEQMRQITRIRSTDAAGNTYRVNEAEPGIPLRPDEPPMPGDQQPPDGPGDSPGPSGPGSADSDAPGGPSS